MKKFITILISCSLAMAAGAMAQQEETSPQPPKKAEGERKPAKEARPPATEMHPGKELKPATEPKVEKEMKPMPKPEATHKEHAETKTPVEVKSTPKALASPEATPVTKVRGKDATRKSAAQAEERKKEQTTSAVTATPAASATATATKMASPTPASVATASPTATAAATPVTSTTPAVSPVTGASPQANKVNPQAKKPDPQVVQKIRTEHATFKAEAKPEKVPTVTFNQSYRIEGSDRWQGQQYEKFRSYRPEMHDQGYYRSHYTKVEIIGGGAYYLNDGYWYPAWGYDRSAQYYPYDGPIYVGHRAEPPDRVIADVQALLQQQGYYRGEVDGLLGPLTRQALTAYQADNGLYTTAVIDEPTLDSLNLG
ncbi:MAG: peptidoglycan-binding protein [Verrucomicrobiota bacterium]|nr:peptidoglycan-binding protein [Verrucomicrobiota bacterium]